MSIKTDLEAAETEEIELDTGVICVSSSNFLHFTAAKYYAPGNPACSALSNALAVTKGLCDYRFYCIIEVGKLYDDPCPGYSKKLEVRKLELLDDFLYCYPTVNCTW